jgi:hypothetical protein
MVGNAPPPTPLASSRLVVLGASSPDPAAILAASVRGPSDLYVALTRATARLGVVHPGDLPPVLARLRPATLEEISGRPR